MSNGAKDGRGGGSGVLGGRPRLAPSVSVIGITKDGVLCQVVLPYKGPVIKKVTAAKRKI